jgi:SAM-dependent methyltransferase
MSDNFSTRITFTVAPPTPAVTPPLSVFHLSDFHSLHYLRHNQRRQEHLATLGLDIAGRNVLEVGAGIGDHTSFFLDRGCRVVTSDARPENIEMLRARFASEKNVSVRQADLDQPVLSVAADEVFDIVYCYGLLYHLGRPAEALKYFAAHCSGLLLLELCVGFGDDEAVNLVCEPQADLSQAWSGTGCRPTRPWVFSRLRENFEFAYVTRTQPWHEEFPLDWSPAAALSWPAGRLSRAVFVGSRTSLALPSLNDNLVAKQTRC